MNFLGNEMKILPEMVVQVFMHTKLVSENFIEGVRVTKQNQQYHHTFSVT
jgi:hypothetical protein